MNKVLDIREVAGRLQVSINTVRGYINRGEFPGAFKTGRGINSHWRIPEQDVDKFVERLRQAAGAGGENE